MERRILLRVVVCLVACAVLVHAQYASPCAAGPTALTVGSTLTYPPPGAGMYPQNLNCQWTVQDSSHFAFTFNYVKLDDGKLGCPGDFIRIYDGLTTSSPLLGRLCGPSDYIVPEGVNVLIEFISDGQDVDPSFFNVANTIGFQIAITPNNQEIHASCSGYTTITEDNYGNTYCDGCNCGYTQPWRSCSALVSVPGFSFVKFQITAYDTDGSVTIDAQTVLDVIEFYDGIDATAPLMLRVDAQTGPQLAVNGAPWFVSSSPTLYIVTYSNATQLAVTNLAYQVMASNGETVPGGFIPVGGFPYGVISSFLPESFVQPYSYATTTWLVTPNALLSLDSVYLYVSLVDLAPGDFVEINETGATPETQLALLGPGTAFPLAINTTSVGVAGVRVLSSLTNPDGAKKGVTMHYLMYRYVNQMQGGSTPCFARGQNFTFASSGILTEPQSGGNIELSASQPCSWLLSGLVQVRIAIRSAAQFVSLEGSTGCASQGLVLYDGLDENSPKLTTWCGVTSWSGRDLVVVSSGPYLLLRTYSMLDTNDAGSAGFALSVENVTVAEPSVSHCSGSVTLTVGNGTFSAVTPYNSSALPPYRLCRFLISPPAASVRVRMLSLDLPATTDFVEIFDGPDTSAPLLYVYHTNDTSFPDVLSSGGNMTVVLQTQGDTTPASGFNAVYETAKCLPPASGPGKAVLSDGSTLTVTCLYGGQSTSQCQTDGAWLPTPVTCQGGPVNVNPPRIDSINPPTVPLSGGVVVLSGDCWDLPLVDVSFDGIPGMNLSAVAGPPMIAQVNAPATANPGYRRVTLTDGSNRQSVIDDGVFFSDDCPDVGYIGTGTECQPCPEGAYCPGGNRIWPLRGYWNSGEFSGYVVGCADSATDRCLGGRFATCGEGYQGPVCGQCVDGYYPSGVLCVECPPGKSQIALYVVNAIVFACLGGAMIVLEDRPLGYVVKGFKLLQALRTAGVKSGSILPDGMRYINDYLALITFDYDFLQPACGEHPKNPKFETIFWGNAVVLLCLIVPTFAIIGVLEICHKSQRSHWISRSYRARSIFTNLTYFIITSRAIQSVTCIKLGTEWVLRADTTTSCSAASGVLPVGVLGLISITFGVPVGSSGVLIWLWRRGRLDDKESQKFHGYLYRKLRTDHLRFFFDTLALLHLLLLALAWNAFPPGASGYALAIFSYAAMIIVTITWRPHVAAQGTAFAIVSFGIGLVSTVANLMTLRGGEFTAGSSIATVVVLAVVFGLMALTTFVLQRRAIKKENVAKEKSLDISDNMERPSSNSASNSASNSGTESAGAKSGSNNALSASKSAAVSASLSVSGAASVSGASHSQSASASKSASQSASASASAATSTSQSKAASGSGSGALSRDSSGGANSASSSNA